MKKYEIHVLNPARVDVAGYELDETIGANTPEEARDEYVRRKGLSNALLQTEPAPRLFVLGADGSAEELPWPR